MSKRAAKIVSYVLSNPVTGGVGGLALMASEGVQSSGTALKTVAILFFYSLLPFASVYYLRLRGRSDVFMSDRARRPKHFIPGLIGYAVSTILFKAWGTRLLTVASASFFSTSLILLFFTFRIKASIHVSGLATVAMLFLYSHGALGLVPFSLLPPLAWARVNTGEHTYPQTILGALIGFVGTSLTLIFFKP
jgi:hypothetical protein